ncbi:MAG: hypothetical protein OZ921_03320 [Sorangiineae bacterium]|nr:hypothetical protein [Polyangiaceae bacterium]MEB2321519.1 hypothetical protein [Sorangiineae bacterium]
MPHPLARTLAPLIDLEVDELRAIVARWVLAESDERERARYRRFGAELRALKARVGTRVTPPTEEEIEIALTALLVLSGPRAQAESS